MPKAKKTDIQLLNEKAEALAEVRVRIRTKEVRFKEETDADYALEKALKDEILLGMKTVGIASVRTTDGDTYTISKTHDFAPSNPIQFDAWARENRLVRVDSSMVKAKLRELLKKGNLPEFIEARERETISIRAAKKEETTPETE